MFAYDKTFDPEVVLGHYDLISRFSDFALYLDTQLVYFHTFFRLMSEYDFATYISALKWFMNKLRSHYVCV